MSTERYRRWPEIEPILEQALDLPDAERGAFITQVCSGDAELLGAVQRLQRGSDVIELDLRRVERAARGLDVVLELLAALIRTIPLTHGARPDPACDPANDAVLGVHAVGEEETEIRREFID